MVEFQKTIPILRIFDVEKAKAFYVGFLGFTVDWEHHFDENTPRLPASVEGRVDAAPVREPRRLLPRLDSLRVDDRPGIETTFYDAKCVEVIDPFGNRIRFNENLKSSPTT